jgi:hypothetical protein
MNEPSDTDSHSRLLSPPVIVALIGAAATVLAAALTGFFGLLDRGQPAVAPAPSAVPAAQLTVRIDGPETAPLGEPAFFTIVSANAERAIWSVGGFNNNEPIAIDPLPPSYQIQIEPTDPGRIGDNFTLVVTVSDNTGHSATATHAFEITPAGN